MSQLKLDAITVEIIDLLNHNKSSVAFKILVDTYHKTLYWHIRRIVLNHDDANDVLQNTYIKIWNNLPKFKGNSKIYSWLYRIATNESISFLNKQKRTISLDVAPQLNSKSTTNEDVLIDGNSIQKKLQLAINTLPTKQRIVFNLKYFDELKYTEIATITNTSVGALKSSYHLAVKKIATFLKQD